MFNTRLQGGLYAGALALAAFFVVGLALRERVRQFVIYCLVFFAIGVAPYSIRNGVVEGRFSPSSQQAAIWLAVYNDPRVKLHGVRFWDGSEPVIKEWGEKYPDAQERLVAQRRYFLDRLLNAPEYFLNAIPWRLASFYGLLPFGAVDRVFKEMDWAKDGWLFMNARVEYWALILVSILAWLALFNSPTNLLFAGLILSNVLLGLSTGQSEARLSYPTLILHLLMGCAVFGRYAIEVQDGSRAGRVVAWRGWFVTAGLVLLLVIPIARAAIGQRFDDRTIPAVVWLPRQTVVIDKSLPLIDTKGGRLTVDGAPVTSLEIGKRYRMRLHVTNLMHPPKHACCLSDFTRLLRENDKVQYYFSFISGDRMPVGTLAVRFDGAEVVDPIVELSDIDAVVKIEAEPKYPYPARYWAHVEKAVVVRPPAKKAGG